MASWKMIAHPILSQPCRTLQGSAHADLSRTLLFLSIQERQIALPNDREYPRKHESILWQYESEAKSRNSWP
jgi:hypothetical protein